MQVSRIRLTLLWHADDRRWLVLNGAQPLGFLTVTGGTYAEPWVSYRPEPSGDEGTCPACDDWQFVLEWMIRSMTGATDDRAPASLSR